MNDLGRRASAVAIVGVCLAAVVGAADTAWKWGGPSGDKVVSMLIIGDIDIQLRADPTTAFAHIGDTLKRADLVYANLEGVLVKPQGRHQSTFPTSEGGSILALTACKALKAWNIGVVGAAKTSPTTARTSCRALACSTPTASSTRVPAPTSPRRTSPRSSSARA